MTYEPWRACKLLGPLCEGCWTGLGGRSWPLKVVKSRTPPGRPLKNQPATSVIKSLGLGYLLLVTSTGCKENGPGTGPTVSATDLVAAEAG